MMQILAQPKSAHCDLSSAGITARSWFHPCSMGQQRRPLQNPAAHKQNKLTRRVSTVDTFGEEACKMLECLKELICDMAKFLTRLGAGLILSALPISNKESHFVRYARRFGFRADHTKREPRAEIGGRGCIQGARPAIRAD